MTLSLAGGGEKAEMAEIDAENGLSVLGHEMDGGEECAVAPYGKEEGDLARQGAALRIEAWGDGEGEVGAVLRHESLGHP